MEETKIAQMLADALAKYPKAGEIRSMIKDMEMDYKTLTKIWVKNKNIDDLILEYNGYKTTCEEAIVRIEFDENSPDWAKKQSSFMLESWVAYHTAVIEYLEKQKQPQPQPQSKLKSLFYGQTEFQKAIKAAQEAGLINEHEKWIMKKGKTIAASIFWHICVKECLAKPATVRDLRNALNEYFVDIDLGINGVNTNIDVGEEKYKELYNAIIRHF